jgi:hypothetical protein
MELNVDKAKYMLVSHHQNAGQNWNITNSKQSIRTCVTVQIFGDDSNKSKFDLAGN